MRTYRELFRTPEFTPLFVTSAGQVAGQTVGGLALGTLIFSATGSPLLSALAMFGPSLAQLIGAATLLSAADRLPPRTAIATLTLVLGLGTAAQAAPGLPVWGTFALLLPLGLIASLGGGVRYGLLNEILSADGYLLGRSVLNMTAGTMQICGYGLGGVLLTVLSPRGALLVGAALYLAAALTARLGLGSRPPRATGRPSVAETWRTNALLWSSVPRRYVYLGLWVPNGLIVGCESLFVAYSPRHAGLLFACGALGMLAGDTVVGRFVPRRRRERIGGPLRLVLAAPFLVFALDPGLPVVVPAVTLATFGFSATLLLQEQLMEITPPELSGHALGLHSAGMLAMQGVSAALAGALAQFVAPATAMATMSAASVLVTLALAPGLRRDRSRSTAAAADGRDIGASAGDTGASTGGGEPGPATGPGATGRRPEGHTT